MDTKDFTVTTIYFDGQFWCALIERHLQNQYFVGKHVFGAEPSNPKLLEWMLNDFSHIKLFPVNQNELPKIRLKKIAGKNRTNAKNAKNQIPKSLKAFSAAQKEFLARKKSARRKQNRQKKQEQWKQKHEAKKMRK